MRGALTFADFSRVKPDAFHLSMSLPERTPQKSTARAIASLIRDDELNRENIIPSLFDKRVCPAVAKAVADAAIASGSARSVEP